MLQKRTIIGGALVIVGGILTTIGGKVLKPILGACKDLYLEELKEQKEEIENEKKKEESK